MITFNKSSTEKKNLAIPGTLADELANVRTFSLLLAFAVLSVIMVIAGAVHRMCYGEKETSVRAVLYTRIPSRNTNYGSAV